MFLEIKKIRRENQECREDMSKHREENELTKKELENIRERVDYLESKIAFY